jgi:hypothetical protein
MIITLIKFLPTYDKGTTLFAYTGGKTVEE